jgi:indolepyruvate ferredoxin oxidoreductase alpha subunit
MGIACKGKDKIPMCGELSSDIIREAITGKKKKHPAPASLPGRPPSMCPGCPHRGMLWAIKRNKSFIAGDIGCYTLGFLPPLDAIDTCQCMGAGISHAHGMSKVFGAKKEKITAVIGDSTFYHSGLTGLLNLAYNNGTALIVILDNSTTAMTGAQNHPGTGVTLGGEKTINVNMAELVRALGIRWVETIDPYDIKNARKKVKEALDYDGPAVIISKAPCVLLKSKTVSGKALAVDTEKCTNCRVCISLGCPAIEAKEDSVKINSLCVGCGICADVCASGAIGGVR